MSSFVSEIRQTIIPGRDTRDGPLPPLLVAMTLVTGLVDAFSYLLLGHVFVANMTGNVVLLGFALVGAVVGEFLGSKQGIGLLISTAQGAFNASGVFAAMIVLAVVALAADYLLTSLERRLLKWKPAAF